jgi:hypothetical protein
VGAPFRMRLEQVIILGGTNYVTNSVEGAVRSALS